MLANGGIDNEGQLDVYAVRREGRKEPMIFYLNTYEEGALLAPKGLASVR
ncbi:hypothetical protein [Hymenobacter rubidus]|nr:hypothetical protein [Hymenobacter rubidus]